MWIQSPAFLSGAHAWSVRPMGSSVWKGTMVS